MHTNLKTIFMQVCFLFYCYVCCILFHSHHNGYNLATNWNEIVIFHKIQELAVRTILKRFHHVSSGMQPLTKTKCSSQTQRQVDRRHKVAVGLSQSAVLIYFSRTYTQQHEQIPINHITATLIRIFVILFG